MCLRECGGWGWLYESSQGWPLWRGHIGTENRLLGWSRPLKLWGNSKCKGLLAAASLAGAGIDSGSWLGWSGMSWGREGGK